MEYSAGLRPLTFKQERAVACYLEFGDKCKAYREAYDCTRMAPSTARRKAQALFAKPQVAARIAHVRARAEEKTEITAERVLQELAKIAFSDMADYCHWSNDGVEFFSSSDLPPGATAAVKKVHCNELVSRSGTVTRNMRIELHDKLGALLALAKHLGLDKPKEDPKMRPLMVINLAPPSHPDRHVN